jgi:integration host factor subunit beta
MIRSELVFRIAALNPHLYEKDCEAVVDTILGRIEAALVAGDRVEIRGVRGLLGQAPTTTVSQSR